MNFRNEIEIKIIGLRRSGNHAVVNWITSLFPGSICFLNDVLNNPAKLREDQPCSDLPGLTSNRRVSAEKPKKLLLYNLEDCPLEESLAYWLPASIAGSSRQRMTILLLRDPYNCAASRLQLIRKLGDTKFSRALRDPCSFGGWGFVNLWKNHAEGFLSIPQDSVDQVYPLNYNDWISGQPARRALCKAIGGCYSEVNLHQVPVYGFGSSFEGSRISQLADPVGLLRRWKHFEKDPEFHHVVSDPEMHALASRIFGSMAVKIQESLGLVVKQSS